MKRLIEKLNSKLLLTFGFLYFVLLPEINFVAASTSQVRSKLNSGFTAIQGVLTGVVVIIGVIAAIKIFIRFMPSLDDPHMKNEMWKAIGGVGVAVGGAAAAVWIVPWIFKLFT